MGPTFLLTVSGKQKVERRKKLKVESRFMLNSTCQAAVYTIIL